MKDGSKIRLSALNDVPKIKLMLETGMVNLILNKVESGNMTANNNLLLGAVAVVSRRLGKKINTKPGREETMLKRPMDG